MEQKTSSLEDIDGDEWRIPVMPDLPIYVHPSRMLRFDDERVLGELEKQIEAIRPKVVLIDPLYSTTSSVDGYMADLTNQMMVLKTWRDRYGCSFLIAHHSRKNIDPDSTAREDSWGSQFLNAFLEAGWQIRRNPRLADNEVVVRRHSKVMGNQPPVSLTFNISTVFWSSADLTGNQTGSLQGSRFRCSTTTTVNIQSGTQGQFRHDIVGLHFSRETSGREGLEFQVLTGEPAASEGAAADPSYTVGNLLKGDAEAFMPLYRVKLSGINASDPEPMFSVLTPLGFGAVPI